MTKMAMTLEQLAMKVIMIERTKWFQNKVKIENDVAQAHTELMRTQRSKNLIKHLDENSYDSI